MWRSIGLLLSALVAARVVADEGSVASGNGGTLAVELEIVVSGFEGRPVVNLEQKEVDVIQEAKHQVLESFAATGEPGHYSIRYVPDSGRPGSVAVWVLRKGTRVRGPKGGDLEPRVVRGLSGLEATLVRLLDEKTDGDLGCATAVLHFERGPKGLKHLFTAEVPLARLKFDGLRGRVQILVRIRGSQGPARHLTLDRAVAVQSPSAIGVERLIWTSSVWLEPGRYEIEMLVHDPNAGRHDRRSLALEVPAADEGIRISSVTSLQDRSGYFEGDGEADLALVYEGIALMPKLDPVYERGADAHLRLFATLYPDSRSAAPVSLHAELLLDGRKVADLPTALPKPEPNGEVRWAAHMATRELPVGRWQLALVAQQGGTTASGQASFEVVELLDRPDQPLRLGY